MASSNLYKGLGALVGFGCAGAALWAVRPTPPVPVQLEAEQVDAVDWVSAAPASHVELPSHGALYLEMGTPIEFQDGDVQLDANIWSQAAPGERDSVVVVLDISSSTLEVVDRTCGDVNRD